VDAATAAVAAAIAADRTRKWQKYQTVEIKIDNTTLGGKGAGDVLPPDEQWQQ
jgi:hypothetical protein